jgi:hypothetical protein
MNNSWSPARLGRLLLLGAIGVATASGCTRPPVSKNTEVKKDTTNPWPGVVSELRKANDPASIRRVFGDLNNDLAQNPVPEFLPAGLSERDEPAIRQTLNLTDEEGRELRSSSYSGLDAQYLSQCLYLRDAARSLESAGIPPARQAELAFAWVCRQVVPHQWVSRNPQTGQGERMPPVPPVQVLRRGSGSGLERAYVFLALLQQLGLGQGVTIDGCLIGTPESVNRDWTFADSSKPNQPPKGPFWAVGARVGADIFLFDPFRGEPLPGPGGVATLAQVKADPNQLKSWFDDKNRPWDVTKQEVAAAVPYLALPLSAAAPRMTRLESELKADAPVRLAINPTAFRERFSAETKLSGVAYWNPSRDTFSYTRLLDAYFPGAEGGHSTVPDLSLRYQNDLIPRPLYVPPPGLLQNPNSPLDPGILEAATRIGSFSDEAFKKSFLAPPTPLERIQRGQFFEVAPILVATRKEFTAAQERVRTDRNRDEAVKEWVKKAHDVYARLNHARAQKSSDPVELADAQQTVDAFWKASLPTVAAIIDTIVSDAGLQEATYLLALCRHEQAEREQERYERLSADPRQKAAAVKAREKAVDAWGEAKGWWVRYAEFAAVQERAYPGRVEHARRLTERATRLAAAAQ